MRKALVLGASGLVGGHVEELLARDPAFSAVTSLVRRPRRPPSPGKAQEHAVDFDAIGGPTWNGLSGTDLFCCLGTTIKKAGSQEAFRKVDFTAVVESARLLRERGVTRLLLVTAVGSDAKSKVFYSRVKGETEEAVAQLGFAAVHVFRPSFLTGDRKERRPGEHAGILAFAALSPLLLGPLRKYRPVPARTVAGAMIRMAKEGPDGFHVHESDRIHELFPPSS